MLLTKLTNFIDGRELGKRVLYLGTEVVILLGKCLNKTRDQIGTPEKVCMRTNMTFLNDEYNKNKITRIINHINDCPFVGTNAYTFT